MNLIIPIIYIILNLNYLKLEYTCPTDLDSYVFNDDDISIVKLNLLNKTQESKYTKYKLNLTSLKWFDDSLSTRSIWWHDLIITIPNKYDSFKPIFFYIDSGENNLNDTKDEFVNKIANLSSLCNCITVSMRQVPNQPITFMNDPFKLNKTEDEIVSWTFRMFFDNLNQTNSSKLPIILPMTKAVRRGIDNVIKFLKDLNLNFTPKFIASGISKRGWTSWLITAVDTRVIGAVPIVFDLINWNRIFHSYYMSLGGGYPYALKDYYDQNLTSHIDSFEFYKLTKLIDPYSYFDRYVNKSFMLLLSSNDEFMLVENTRFFWSDLSIITEQKCFMRRFTNVEHSLNSKTDQIIDSMKNFMHLFNLNKFPKFIWKFANNKTDANIQINLDKKWHLFSSFDTSMSYAFGLDKIRDYRIIGLNENGKVVERLINWNTKILSYNNTDEIFKHTYGLSRNLTLDKYISFYIDVSLKFKNELNQTEKFILSTDVNIIPEYYPTSDCFQTECFGILV